MNTREEYPYLSFRFLVEIQGLIVGGFSEVAGLQAETEVETIEEGVINDYVHAFPKRTKYPNLILRRGVTDSDTLWKWYQEIVKGKISRKSIFIMLLDSEGDEIWKLHLVEAYPVKWIGPDLKADSTTVAIESLELVHNGIKRA